MAKIALGMITRNERDFLEKTLFHKGFNFDYKFAVDFFSNDYTPELLGTFGFNVHSQEWVGHYGIARNILIQVAEEAGMDWLFMLDADEAMNESDLETCRVLAESGNYEILTLSRVEFVQDFHHYDPTLYPDYQTRFFKLHQGYHFRNKVHEMLYQGNDEPSVTEQHKNFIVPNVNIYHYGRLKDKQKTILKYINYDRMMKGEEPLDAIPDGYDWENGKLWERLEEYTKPHPLQNL